MAIEEIQAGDWVYAENPETGEKGLKRVVRTFVNEASELIHIKAGGQEITTTPEHPFWVPQKGWTDAVELRAGDMLVLLNGELVVVEQVQHEILESPVTVYNFEVEDFHTYYVSKISVLVHNTCRGGAVKNAWKAEQQNVMNGGKGINTRWSEAQRIELINTGRVKGYVGHHMKSVRAYPHLAGDPTNIQFLTRLQHFEAHAFRWWNATHGPYRP